MVTSSHFIACSVNAMRNGRQRSSVRWLVAGLVTLILTAFLVTP